MRSTSPGIDIQTEGLLTLGQIAKRVPGRAPGKNLNSATIWRWATRGVRGVTLETVLVGSIRMSTMEAVQRFVDRLTEQADEKAPTVSAAARHGRAEAYCQSAGF